MGWPVRHAGKEDKQVQKFLQKLEGVSQALLDPLSYLTAAGLLLVVGHCSPAARCASCSRC